MHMPYTYTLKQTQTRAQGQGQGHTDTDTGTGTGTWTFLVLTLTLSSAAFMQGARLQGGSGRGAVHDVCVRMRQAAARAHQRFAASLLPVPALTGTGAESSNAHLRPQPHPTMVYHLKLHPRRVLT
jgi:hypothetical protein